MYLFSFRVRESVWVSAILLCMFASLSSAQVEDKCEVNFYGQSYVWLSGTNSIFHEDSLTHTFEFRFNPRKGTNGEQSLLQTGIVRQKDTLWAVEFKFKTTIWQHQEYPASSVVYIDEWSKQSTETHWHKTRHYIVLEGASFPWLHLSFTRGGEIVINGKQRRLDKYTTVAVDTQPRETFALGASYNGALDEVRIWEGDAVKAAAEYMQTTICAEDVKSKLALYIPFNECKGNTFTGFTHGAPVCATINAPQEPVWTHTSPIANRACSLTAEALSYCDKLSPADDPNIKNPSVAPTPADAQSVQSSAFVFSLLEPQTGGLLLVLIILAMVALSRVRSRTERPPVAAV